MLAEAIAAFDLAAQRGAIALAHAIAGESLPALDWAARLLVELDALKMGVPTFLAMYAWLRPDRGYRADPLRALRGAAGVVLALVLARLAQESLPERPRPRVALPDLPFPPLGHLSDLADWSSMPSDTAALAFALAAVAWASSRRLGAAAVAWAAVMTCAPRLYFGYHYLSDLVVGAASVALALNAPAPAGIVAGTRAWLRRIDARAPVLLPLAFFALGAECLHLFQSTRKMADAAGDVVAAVSAKEHGAGRPSGAVPTTGGGGAARPAPALASEN